MKKLLIILGGLIALAVVVVVVLAFSLGSIVKAGVNKFGPGITQTTVVLQGANISPLSGKGTLSDLTIGNPQGWQTPRAFYLGKISIDVDTSSLRGDHIVINSIIIDQPEITYETKITSSNLQDILKNIQKASGDESTGQPPAEEPAKTDEGKPIKIEIKQFRFQNAKVTVAGAGETLPVTIPLIALDNLGTKEGGLTPAELSQAVMKEVIGQAIQAGAKVAAEKGLINKASEGLQKLLGGGKK